MIADLSDSGKALSRHLNSHDHQAASHRQMGPT